MESLQAWSQPSKLQVKGRRCAAMPRIYHSVRLQKRGREKKRDSKKKVKKSIAQKAMP
jgi:hypothetical protein